MNRKRILPIALIALVIIGVIVGICIGASGPQKVGICVHDLSDQGAKEYAELLYSRLSIDGYEVSLTDAKNDQSLQNSQIEEWSKEKYAAVIISPVMVSAVAETVEIAKASDMPILFINKPVSSVAFRDFEKACYVGSPDGQWGNLLGEAILDLPDQADMNGDGVISYLLAQDHSENAQKQSGVNDLLQTLQSANVNTNQIRQFFIESMQSESNTRCAQALAQYGKDIEIIICDSEAGVLGAMQAVKDGGRVVGRDIYLVSTADTQQVLQEVEKGNITAVIHRDRNSLIKKTAEVLKQLLEGLSPEAVNLVDYVTLTPENASHYLQSQE